MEKDCQCIKIKDGLYLANRTIAADLQFLVINKFAFIINCASAEIPCYFQEQGIKYLKFKLNKNKNEPIFDEDKKRLKKTTKFLNEVQQSGMCCLLHCGIGQNRSLTILIAYLMDNFNWRLRKTVQFLKSKQISPLLTQSNIKELQSLQEWLLKQKKLTSTWSGPYETSQQQIISKTFLNTSKTYKQISKYKLLHYNEKDENDLMVEKKQKRVQWQDKIDKQVKLQKKKGNNLQKLQKQMNKSQVNLNQISKMAKDKNKSKKKLDNQLDKSLIKKIQQAQILKLIKKSNNLRKQLLRQQIKNQQIKQIQLQQQQSKIQQKKIYEQQDKKVYKVTINNYINPNINIIKPTEKKKKSTKNINKQEKGQFDRTYSEKQTFKKHHLYDGERMKQKEKEKKKDFESQKNLKEKRNTGTTPIRNRKQRKSQKEKEVESH